MEKRVEGERERATDDDELRTGGRIPVLKNADEAEVKESRTRPKSQADLLSVATVLVHLTVTCVCSLVRFRRSTPLTPPTASLSRVIPEGTFRDLDVLTPHSSISRPLRGKLSLSLLYFDHSLARCPIRFLRNVPISSRDKW